MLEPGQVVLHRHFARDVLVWAPLTRVVADDELGLRLWLQHGSPLIRQVTLDGENPRDMPFVEWIKAPKHIIHDTYRGPSILKFNPRGAAYSVWWLWAPDGRFAAWYLNLEEPSVRWRDGDLVGVDLTDQDLDVWVWPDRTWSFKDEDELEERLDFPEHYWVDDGPAVYAQAHAVVPDIEAGRFPFDGTWCDYRPDPQWTIPKPVTHGWDRARAV
jgi:predicted RNA-binding protein associated with RNAse of E/G family